MLWETVKLALQAIFRNALRSFLTVLGVVIGVAAVIAMVTVGEGSTAQVTQDVARLGTNLLMVRPGQPQQGPQTSGGTPPNQSHGQEAADSTQAEREATLAAEAAFLPEPVTEGGEEEVAPEAPGAESSASE